jgi:hypothetical protein
MQEKKTESTAGAHNTQSAALLTKRLNNVTCYVSSLPKELRAEKPAVVASYKEIAPPQFICQRGSINIPRNSFHTLASLYIFAHSTAQ